MDKIFLITGCNSGLGYQLTQKLLALKNTVIGISKTKTLAFLHKPEVCPQKVLGLP